MDAKLKALFMGGSATSFYAGDIMSERNDIALVCRLRASSLRREAEGAETPEERDIFHRLAEHWLRQADTLSAGSGD